MERRGTGPTLQLSTTVGDVQTRNVVCAAGAAAHPRVPAWAASLQLPGAMMHSGDYRYPRQIPPGDVLIVGGGNSGVQIARDLLGSHTVTLSVRAHRGHLPLAAFPAEGRARAWLRRRRPEPVFGDSYQKLRRAGVRVTPEVTGADSGTVMLADGTRIAPPFGGPRYRLRARRRLAPRPRAHHTGMIPVHSHARAVRRGHPPVQQTRRGHARQGVAGCHGHRTEDRRPALKPDVNQARAPPMSDVSDTGIRIAGMTTVSARDASRGFSALLDHVEHGEEYTVVRDGKVIARIVPATTHTVAGFLARRAGRPPLDEDFAADAVSAGDLLAVDAGDPWHD